MTARPNIFPALRCRDARAEIDFLVRAFGFVTHAEHAAPDGSIAHAELHLGPGVVGLSSAPLTPSDHPWSQVRQGVYIRVDDVDAHYERAKRAGADIALPLRDMEYGSREYSARDPDGHLWGFGTWDSAGPVAGEPNLFVGLHYHDARAAIAFFERAFGFEKTVEIPAPDGGVLHAEMRFGAGTIMISGLQADPARWGGNTHHLYVYVPDPDTHFTRAQSSGARIVQPPQQTPFGARAYYAHDPEGFLWGFSTYKPESLKSEV